MNAEQQRKSVIDQYNTLLNRNIYNQSLRTYVFSPYKDGKYYSDCSSSVCYSYKQAGVNLGNLNTAGIYNSTKGTLVDVKITNGIPVDVSKLRVGDCLLFRGSDASRPLGIGHVEMVYSIVGNTVTLCGHGSGKPRLIEMKKYCKSRYNTSSGNKYKNKDLACIKRFIKDDIETQEPKSIKGIDISSYNVIKDYKALKSNYIEFAVLKIINKNSEIDKLFETHLNGCRDAGIIAEDCYNYTYATTTSKAIKDARAVVSALNGRKMRVWLDVEDKCMMTIGAGIVDIINAYKRVISDAGLDFGIYTGMSFYNSYLKPYASEIDCDKLWIARYYNGYNSMIPHVDPNPNYKPNVGCNIWAWQYTSSLSIPSACEGNLDCNVYYGEKSNIYIQDSSDKTEQKVEAEIVEVTANSLNCRMLPNTDGNIICVYKKGQVLDVCSMVNGWYKLNNGYYVSANWCKTVDAVLTGNLNFRTLPDKESSSVKVLKNGDTVTFTKRKYNIDTYWYYSDEHASWCSGKYLNFNN